MPESQETSGAMSYGQSEPASVSWFDSENERFVVNEETVKTALAPEEMLDGKSLSGDVPAGAQEREGE